jgi:hypothetical protein
MTSIVRDGPREWLVDVLDRKLGRALGAAAGATMLAAVLTIDPGLSRQVCAVFGGLLLLRAAWPPRRPASVEDLAQLQAIVLQVRADVEDRDTALGDRLDGITEAVAEIADQDG